MFSVLPRRPSPPLMCVPLCITMQCRASLWYQYIYIAKHRWAAIYAMPLHPDCAHKAAIWKSVCPPGGMDGKFIVTEWTQWTHGTTHHTDNICHTGILGHAGIILQSVRKLYKFVKDVEVWGEKVYFGKQTIIIFVELFSDDVWQTKQHCLQTQWAAFIWFISMRDFWVSVYIGIVIVSVAMILTYFIAKLVSKWVKSNFD